MDTATTNIDDEQKATLHIEVETNITKGIDAEPKMATCIDAKPKVTTIIDVEQKENNNDETVINSVKHDNITDELNNEQTPQSNQSASELMKQLMKPIETVEPIDELANHPTRKLVELNAELEKRREQIMSTVYGQCVGDAVGLLTEFLSESQAKHVSKLFWVEKPVML